MAHGRGRHQKTIDTVHWTYGSFSAFSLAAGTIAVNVLPAQHLPETILRMRGEWTCNPAGVVGPDQSASIAVGLILVPEGTGSTVLWSPITDGDAPWIWWDTMQIVYSETVTDVIAVQGVMSGRRVIDSKAMRKVRNTQLQFVAENATLQSALSLDVVGAVRVLTGS